MFKRILIFLLIFFIVISVDQEEVDKAIKRVKYKTKNNQKLETQLKNCQNKLTQMEWQCCQKQKSIKNKLLAKVAQLEQKVKEYVKNGGSKIDESTTELVNFYKQKALSLQNKLKIQSDRVSDILSQKQSLEKKILDYKEKAKSFVDKIKDLQNFKSEEQKSYKDQIKKIKDYYESRLRDSVGQKCEAVSTQIVRRQQKCQKQLKTFGDKIKDLEYSASSRAKQLADKIMTTKNQMVTRIKNYFTGKGPYNREDEEAFGEFKKRVQYLQQKLEGNLEQIDRVRKQKQDIDLQQKYYRAQLIGLNDQIRIIEEQARSKGKSYYIDEINRLFRQSRKVTEDSSFIDKNKWQKAQQEVLQLNAQNKKLKQQVNALSKELKIQSDRVSDILSQKQSLEKKILDYKKKAKSFEDKIKDLQNFKSEGQKSYKDQIKKIKDNYESRLRDSVGQKCEAVSTQIVRRQQKCQKQLKTFGDKIKDLEYSASSRAKQLADKIMTTKNQMVTRIKNYFTGKGPYNREDEEAFGEFKKRVQQLQQKLEKQGFIDKNKWQKAQHEAQQLNAQNQKLKQQVNELRKLIKQIYALKDG